MPAAAGSWRPRGRSSCATCMSGARRPATGPGPTRWSRVRWTGPTASSRRRSARSRCGAGSGSIRGPSPRRCVRCIHRSVLGSRPKLLLRIRAGRVHPVTAPSIEDGAVLVDANGRIAAVGPNARVPTPRGVPSLEFPDAELLPGLINCHTHLELTHLGGGVQHEEAEFLTWIRRIRELKEATSAEAFYEAALAGVRDCWARGVTCVAETGSTGAVMRALRDLGGRGIVYQEVFGPDPAQCSASMQELEKAVLRLRRLATAQLSVGVSPHAPYTVSAPLYDAVAAFARNEGLPIAVHAAESQEETALVHDGAGPFADALRSRGIPVEGHRCSPVAYVMQRGVLRSGTLCIHCVQVDKADVDLLRSA